MHSTTTLNFKNVFRNALKNARKNPFKFKFSYLAMVLLLILGCDKEAESQLPGSPDPVTQGFEYYKVWSEGEHNAFTDLTLYKGKFYLVLREGTTHGSDDGAIRVLESTDGKAFHPVFRVSDPQFDLRDPKIVNVNDTLLYVQFGMSDRPKKLQRNGMIWSKDGAKWTEKKVYSQDDAWWLWSVIKVDNELFSVGYKPYKNDFNRIYRAKSPGKYEQIGVIPTASFSSGEASIVDSKDTIFCAIRATHYSLPAFVGYAPKKNLKDWKCFPQHTSLILGGPKLFVLPNKKLYLITRSNRNDNLETCLYRVDRKTFELTYLRTIPSRGDNSYGGVAVTKTDLFISYYTTFEAKSEIYMARIPLTDID